ncbi:MAG: hypothetical protein Q3972_00830 [Corynebacterium sp.]|nr:hypothetical protein [Corynebacterium sp.]
MSDTWDSFIFSTPNNEDYLESLDHYFNEGYPESVVENMLDTCLTVTDGDASEADLENAALAATITAIWLGAPYTIAEIVDQYPWIKNIGLEVDDELYDAAATVLERAAEHWADEEFEFDVFTESLG